MPFLFISFTWKFQLNVSQLKPHNFIPNDLLIHAGIASRFSATGVITVVDQNDNSVVLIVSHDDEPDNTPLVIHGEMFELPLPPIDHLVVLRGNILSIRWAEAFLAIENLTVL